jgi:hypothetical protein
MALYKKDHIIKNPKIGDQEIRSKFVWFPMTLRTGTPNAHHYQTRWFGVEKVVYKYSYDKEWIPYAWVEYP